MKKNKWIIGVLAAVLLVLAVSTGVVLAETLPETYVETTEPGEPSEVEPEEPENTPQPQETPTPDPEPEPEEPTPTPTTKPAEKPQNTPAATKKPDPTPKQTEKPNTAAGGQTVTSSSSPEGTPTPSPSPTPSATPTPTPGLQSSVNQGVVSFDGEVSVTVSQTDNSRVNFIGILAWVCIGLGVAVVLLVLLSNRRGPRGGGGRKRYQRSKTPRRKKGKLLSDRYYRDSFRGKYR